MQLQSAHYTLDLPAEVVLQDRELTEELLAPLQPARGHPSLKTLRQSWRNLRGKDALPSLPTPFINEAFGHLRPHRKHLSYLYLVRGEAVAVFIPVRDYDLRSGRRRNIPDLIRSMGPRAGDSVIAVMDHRFPGTTPRAVLHGLRLT